MSMWGCECVGVWVCGCVGVRVCGWVWGAAGPPHLMCLLPRSCMFWRSSRRAARSVTTASRVPQRADQSMHAAAGLCRCKCRPPCLLLPPGLMGHTAGLCAVMNPTVNSYVLLFRRVRRVRVQHCARVRALPRGRKTRGAPFFNFFNTVCGSPPMSEVYLFESLDSDKLGQLKRTFDCLSGLPGGAVRGPRAGGAGTSDSGARRGPSPGPPGRRP